MTNRNNTVDAIRGLAMLMVVLQHTIAGSTIGFEHNFFFNLIWSVQMPLFFIISGYVTRYSKPIRELHSLLKFFKKRTYAYIIPWIVWSFLIRGLLLEQTSFFDLKYLLWHMDSGYWFLVSLWTIVILFGVSDYFSSKIGKRGILEQVIYHGVFMFVGMCALLGLGFFMEIDFLSIKLTLYYIPLYFLGYLFGQYQDKLSAQSNYSKYKPFIVAVAMTVWVAILVRLDIFGAYLTPLTLGLRYMAAICGSIVVIYCIANIYRGGVSCDGRILLPSNIRDTLSVLKLTICGDRDSEDNRTDGHRLGFNQLHSNSNSYDLDNHNNESKQILVEVPVLQGRGEDFLKRGLIWCGNNSLAIYLLHGFYLNLCITSSQWLELKALGIPLLICNFILCLTLLMPTIKLLAANKLLNKIT